MRTLALTCLSFLGLAVLSGCNTRPAEPVSSAYVWNFFFDGDEARLAYGRPNSDEVGLMMTCVPHSGALALSDVAEPGRKVLTLVSGPARSDLAGASEPDPLTGGELIEAAATIGDPAIAGFARSGRLTVVHEDRRIAMPTSAADRTAVDRFFAACA
jgi:hypothetical protein